MYANSINPNNSGNCGLGVSPSRANFQDIAVILTLLINKNRFGNRYYSRKSDRGCRELRRKLLNLVHYDTADRLISSAKRQHPGKSERWYLEKVIYDLQRGR